jgi:hypothetical protein
MSTKPQQPKRVTAGDWNDADVEEIAVDKVQARNAQEYASLDESLEDVYFIHDRVGPGDLPFQLQLITKSPCNGQEERAAVQKLVGQTHLGVTYHHTHGTKWFRLVYEDTHTSTKSIQWVSVDEKFQAPLSDPFTLVSAQLWTIIPRAVWTPSSCTCGRCHR